MVVEETVDLSWYATEEVTYMLLESFTHMCKGATVSSSYCFYCLILLSIQVAFAVDTQ